VDVFEVIGALVAGVVAAAVEELGAMSAGPGVVGDKSFPRGGALIALFPGDEVDGRICENLVEDVVAVDAAVS